MGVGYTWIYLNIYLNVAIEFARPDVGRVLVARVSIPVGWYRMAPGAATRNEMIRESAGVGA